MESKVIAFTEYDQVDISAFKKTFCLDEKAFKKEMDFLKNKNSSWEEAEEITSGAIVVCDMKSDNNFFNRENLKLMVGQGFFNKKLEALCVGLKKGTTNELDVDGNKVYITVKSIQQKNDPAITDEMVKNLEIVGVETEEQYKNYLIQKQKTQIIDNEGYEAVNYVMDQVFKNSSFDLKKADWLEMINHEIQRLQAIGEEEGLDLRTMTPEDFEGKMPFKSYHELLVYVQNDSWDKVLKYLLGCIYAERDEVQYTRERYEQDMEEYMEFWHETKEHAEKINTYAYSEISFYINYYYKKVRQYVENNFFEEEN